MSTSTPAAQRQQDLNSDVRRYLRTTPRPTVFQQATRALEPLTAGELDWIAYHATARARWLRTGSRW